MTHYHYRRRPGPIAGLFWLLIAICALVAIAEINPPITAPFAFLLLVLIIAAAVAKVKAARVNRADTIGRKVTPRASIERVTVARQERDCGTCGAPVEPRAA